MAESYNTVPNGCNHYHDCFSCPFDDCVDGELAGAKRRVMRQRVVMMLKRGSAPAEVARIMSISERTVYRYQNRLLQQEVRA